MEDRRRRRVAFEETAKDLLRCSEDSEYLKVNVSELQVGNIGGIGCFHQANCPAGNELKFFRQGEEEVELPVWPDGTRS